MYICICMISNRSICGKTLATVAYTCVYSFVYTFIHVHMYIHYIL